MSCKRRDCYNEAAPGHSHCGRLCAKIFGEQAALKARTLQTAADVIAFRDAQTNALHEAGLWITEYYRLEKQIKPSR